ncbi:MAG: hypothetical protein JW793_15595 [Acidobacteria bacterium]|nr:hypothetical protein [Acidobacteriota bacterium]
MPDLTFDGVKPAAAGKIQPFLQEMLAGYPDTIHSLHITGTAVTDDYDERVSDVNSIVVLEKMDMQFLEFLAPLGKKYGKKKVAAPLIMTPAYIASSLDVFPIEFLNFKRVHSTVYGEDILGNLEIKRMDLRNQCERELKTKLIWLRQGYLSAQGDRKLLTEGFVRSITGYIPLFRGLIALGGEEPPVPQYEVIQALGRVAGVSTDVFSRILREKHEKAKMTAEELHTIFEEYYAATEKLGAIVDEIHE